MFFNKQPDKDDITPVVPEPKVKEVPVYRDPSEAQRLAHNARCLYRQLMDVIEDANKKNVRIYLKSKKTVKTYPSFGQCPYEEYKYVYGLPEYELKADTELKMEL